MLGLHVVNGWWVLSVNNPKEGRQRSEGGDPLPLPTKAASVQLAACGWGSCDPAHRLTLCLGPEGGRSMSDAS